MGIGVSERPAPLGTPSFFTRASGRRSRKTCRAKPISWRGMTNFARASKPWSIWRTALSSSCFGFSGKMAAVFRSERREGELAAMSDGEVASTECDPIASSFKFYPRCPESRFRTVNENLLVPTCDRDSNHRCDNPTTEGISRPAIEFAQGIKAILKDWAFTQLPRGERFPKLH